MERKNSSILRNIFTAIGILIGIGGLVIPILTYSAGLGAQPDLVYVAGNSTFSDEDSRTYIVTFFNFGKGMAEDVKCGLSFSDPIIEKAEYKTYPPTMGLFQVEESEKPHVNSPTRQYGVKLDYMNAGQSITIYARVTPLGSTFADPEIDFYSKTIDGKDLFKSEPERTQWWIILAWSVGVFFLGCIAPRIWRMIKYLWEKTA